MGYDWHPQLTVELRQACGLSPEISDPKGGMGAHFGGTGLEETGFTPNSWWYINDRQSREKSAC